MPSLALPTGQTDAVDAAFQRRPRSATPAPRPCAARRLRSRRCRTTPRRGFVIGDHVRSAARQIIYKRPDATPAKEPRHLPGQDNVLVGTRERCGGGPVLHGRSSGLPLTAASSARLVHLRRVARRAARARPPVRPLQGRTLDVREALTHREAQFHGYRSRTELSRQHCKIQTWWCVLLIDLQYERHVCSRLVPRRSAPRHRRGAAGPHGLSSAASTSACARRKPQRRGGQDDTHDLRCSAASGLASVLPRYEPRRRRVRPVSQGRAPRLRQEKLGRPIGLE